PEVDAHLAEKDAPTPSRPGLTWVHTSGGYLYDTASGDLEIGQYAVRADGSYIENRAPVPFVSSTSTPPTSDAPTSPEVPGASTSSAPAPSEAATGTSSTDLTADSSSSTSDSTQPPSTDSSSTSAN